MKRTSLSTPILALVWASILFSPAKADVLSVLYFDNNTDIQELDWMKKGLADMLITDLAATNKIQVVQREKLEQILKEQRLGQSGLVDEVTASKIGVLVGANRVLTGSFLRLNEVLRINTTLYDVESGKSLGAASVEGLSGNILILEKQLALKLFDILNLGLAEEEKIKVLQMPTQDIEALKYNYKGLAALDEDKRDEAQDFFKKALQQDKYYRSADLNLSRATFAVSGKSLFASAAQEIRIREDSIKAVDELLDLAVSSGFDCVVDVKNMKTEADRSEIGKVEITVPFTITVRADYAKRVWQTLQPFSKHGTGEKGLIYFERIEVSTDPVELWLLHDVVNKFRGGWKDLGARFIFLDESNTPLFQSGWFHLTLRDALNMALWMGETRSIRIGNRIYEGAGKNFSYSASVSLPKIESARLARVSTIRFEVERGNSENGE
ncbi:hypothetical protein HY522_12125 [bacterium]|nr:hypothetical protein [bacterium]